jgi:N-carbamoylputrescine amidase
VELIVTDGVPDSPARVRKPERVPFRVGVVQHRWDDDAARLVAALHGGVEAAAGAGARIVFLPELTLSRYPADLEPTGRPADLAEGPETVRTMVFAREAARAHGIYVQASLYERADLDEDGVEDGLGYNTAVLVAPDGRLVHRTRKMHIPASVGYYEDRYFRPGPPHDAYSPVRLVDPAISLGMPTCWDEWFPEVARSYALAGADLLVYPTAIGSERDHPGFDSRPQWQAVITGQAIANGLFAVVPNRCGDEGTNSFYGSSFVVDPYGRVLVQAPRDEPAVLVADIDPDQRRDWLGLFPFFGGRRPESYDALTAPVRPEHSRGHEGTPDC